MFFSGKKVCDKDIETLREENELLKAKCKSLEGIFEKQREEDYDADICFDFSKVNVFSIERVLSECDENAKMSYTIIGYFIRNDQGSDEVKEWTLYCSLRQHNILVDKFNKLS